MQRLLHPLQSLILLAALLFYPGQGYGAENIAISPLSSHVGSERQPLHVTIQNIGIQAQKVEIVHYCDVDGSNLTGDACLAFFEVTKENKDVPSQITVEAGGRVDLGVRLKSHVSHYALYKPLIRPLVEKSPLAKGVGFEFNFQPGMLFLLDPEARVFELPKFEMHSEMDRKVVRFEWDLGAWKTPQVLSVSAKIMDEKTKKIIKFVRLADNRIIDPLRKTLVLQSELTSDDPALKVCFQVFITPQYGAKVVQNISNCAP